MTKSKLTDQTKSSRQYSSRNGARIDTFLIHHQAGTNDDAVIRAMQTGSRQVSANYTISNEGRLTLVVDEKYRAWTSGSTRDGGKGAAWDRRAITVEIENMAVGGSWPISRAAIETAALLLNDLRDRYGIAYVYGHRDLWARYRASYPTYCPGPDTVASIVKRAKAIRDANVPTLPTDGGPVTPLPPVKPPVKPTPKPQLPLAKVDGKLGKSTWLRLQTWLARDYGYRGPVNGIPGPNTWAAFQRFLKANYNYAGPTNGVMGPNSWRAAQAWLRARYGYKGPVNGYPAVNTYKALQRFANRVKS